MEKEYILVVQIYNDDNEFNTRCLRNLYHKGKLSKSKIQETLKEAVGGRFNYHADLINVIELEQE